MCKKVLVIDDSIPLHKLIATYLEPDNLSIHSAHDGESGLVAAAMLRPSVILLDVDMPRIDGFEVCRRLKADPTTASMPVIFLTANSMVDHRVKGLELGATDYISKPFKPPELRARVRAALRTRVQIETLNLVDASTGLWNRTYLNAHLDYHVSLARRFGVPLSCIIVEVAHGNSFSEMIGDAVVSEVFREVGRILSGGCRAEDVVCRYDVWKFAILAAGVNGAGAVFVADRLRFEAERQMRVRNGGPAKITFNFGVADTIHGEAATLIDRANAAVGGASVSGFNGVFIANAACGALNAVA